VAARAPGADPGPSQLTLDSQTAAAVREAVLGLDRWFDSQRVKGGYGGPVVHWWRDCLHFTGAGLDWRYEGILIGYLNLWAATGEGRWFDKAKRAGDDLVAGQLPNGNFRNSQFELNPGIGGTPHEAACDLALLRLALALRSIGDLSWLNYVATAQRNIEGFLIGQLWDERRRWFRDDPAVDGFVPNKAATIAEAFFALAQLTGDSRWADDYALPTLEGVLEHQQTGGELDGAIAQNSFGSHRVLKFFPFYVARCLPALIEAHAWSGDARFAEAVRRAAQFVLRTRLPDGSFPQVLYPGRRINPWPQWIAATGDMLRALCAAQAVGFSFDPLPTLRWLLAGQRPDGGFRAAVGFGRVTPFGRADDPRDALSVCGWEDKAFRFLASTGLDSKVTYHDPN